MTNRIRPAWQQAPAWMTPEQQNKFYMGIARYLALTETAKSARRQIHDYTNEAYEQNNEGLKLEAADDLGAIPGDSGERGGGEFGDS